MGGPNLRVDVSALNWNPAEVTVPGVPAVAPGSDPMSVLISAVMPGIAEDVTNRVAGTRAREDQFSNNLTAAKSAYQNTDSAGQQDIQAAAGEFSHGGGAAGEPPAATAVSGAGQAGQLSQLGMVTQMAGQAAQMPMQMMGMAAAVPQGITQGVQSAVQQVGQMSGMFGGETGGESIADKMNLDGGADSRPEQAGQEAEGLAHPESERPEDGAGAGNTGGERAPHPSTAAPEETGSAEFPTETAL